MSKTLITGKEAIEKLNNRGDIYIIDGRPEEIYRGGSNQIKDAKHITEQFAREIFLDLPKDLEYLIYMTEGEEDLSVKFAEFLRKKGFDAYAIEGGYEQWRDSGKPIEPINAPGTPIKED